MDWQLPTYTWRGKTYKTIKGITGAALRAYPTYGVNFDKDAMCLHPRNGTTVRFARTFDAAGNSIVADTAS